jgi:hypothetical protein
LRVNRVDLEKFLRMRASGGSQDEKILKMRTGEGSRGEMGLGMGPQAGSEREWQQCFPMSLGEV